LKRLEACDQAEKTAKSGQVAEDLATKLEGITFPSAEAGQKLRQLALESSRSAEDLIAIHAKAQDLISIAALGLSQTQFEGIIAEIVSAGQDLASALSSLVSQAEALTLAQTSQILALREQALAILESGKVVSEEGAARQATLGEITAAAGAVSSFSSWLDATITTLERLITAGNEAVRPLYEQLRNRSRKHSKPGTGWKLPSLSGRWRNRKTIL